MSKNNLFSTFLNENMQIGKEGLLKSRPKISHLGMNRMYGKWHENINLASKNSHRHQFGVKNTKTNNEQKHTFLLLLEPPGLLLASWALGINRLCGILAISHLGGTVDDDDVTHLDIPLPPTPSRPGKKYVVRPGSSLR